MVRLHMTWCCPVQFSSQQSVALKQNSVLQKENKAMMRKVRLVMIDEVHLLNERGRGAVLEALVSRMKTVQNAGMYAARKKHRGMRMLSPILPFLIP
jgi:hypothetical protein